MFRSFIDVRNISGPTFELYNATLKNDLARMKYLIINEKAKPSGHVAPDGYTALHVAANQGYIDGVRLLLEYRASVNARSNDGDTPLHFAAYFGHRDIVSLLLKHGASLDIKNSDNQTPYTLIDDEEIRKNLEDLLNPLALKDDMGNTLYKAAYKGNINFARELISNGANCNFTRPSGWTPLHVAASEGHTKIVSLLLKKGASIDAQDLYGNTALHIAAHNNHKDTVAKLLEYDASADIKNKDNDNPFECIRNVTTRENMEELLTFTGGFTI